ncbi:GNAT family N-acetyltransferase [Clavibacter michiganensis]|uniref:GNAT family N-acetyltransferase n=1 Tax=Clavibacter michiganensis TaxID=28447 RepID=UPI001C6665C1|nr:GNAT family N-acetyltransferase [Clavibacter michiganensis]
MDPRSAAVLRLRPFDPVVDAPALRSWLPDEAAFRLFAGEDAPWPFTDEDAVRAGNPAARAWTAVAAIPAEDAEAKPPARDAGAALEGPPVGHVEIVPDGDGAVRLARIVLSPEVRGRGWGARLVEAAVHRAAAEGALRVGLNVVPGNAAALGAYARAGFVDRGRNRAHPSYVWMERDLRADAPR